MFLSPGVTACQPKHSWEVIISPEDGMRGAGWLSFRAEVAFCPELCLARHLNMHFGNQNCKHATINATKPEHVSADPSAL